MATRNTKTASTKTKTVAAPKAKAKPATTARRAAALKATKENRTKATTARTRAKPAAKSTRAAYVAPTRSYTKTKLSKKLTDGATLAFKDPQSGRGRPSIGKVLKILATKVRFEIRGGEEVSVPRSWVRL